MSGASSARCIAHRVPCIAAFPEACVPSRVLCRPRLSASRITSFAPRFFAPVLCASRFPASRPLRPVPTKQTHRNGLQAPDPPPLTGWGEAGGLGGELARNRERKLHMRHHRKLTDNERVRPDHRGPHRGHPLPPFWRAAFRSRLGPDCLQHAEPGQRRAPSPNHDDEHAREYAPAGGVSGRIGASRHQPTNPLPCAA